MTYNEVLEFMFSSLPMYQRIGKAAYKSDLTTTILLDNKFNNPHRNFKSIHIAGTNGKGSVAHSIASILQEAGYKTGLYTSPHLIDYRERIKIDGQIIEKEFVRRFICDNIDIIKDIEPSFFEMSVALAFEYFSSQKVDIAVIEVGMGGRLDSTNIITPDLSIITNIGFDHTQFLGNSLDKIATEKAGIIKQNIPVIIGETHNETESTFINIAKEKKAEISFADSTYKINKVQQNSNYTAESNNQIIEIDFALKGLCQQKNLATILCSIDKLRSIGYNITDIAIKNGLKNVIKNTHLQGRWQTISLSPLTVCDTAHNCEGLQYTMKQISELTFDKLHIVIGFVNDKNIDKAISLFPKNAIYYFTQASIPRAICSAELKEICRKYDLIGNAFPNISSAFCAAKQNANSKDLIFIGGSTFVVGDFLKEIKDI